MVDSVLHSAKTFARADESRQAGKPPAPFDAGDGIKVRASFLFGVSSSVERANSQERYEWPQNTLRDSNRSFSYIARHAI
jgi:hypothetical protein